MDNFLSNNEVKLEGYVDSEEILEESSRISIKR